MQLKVQNLLNPMRYHLSEVAKQRLSWMYIIYFELRNWQNRS